jgi:hypothetical protein
MKRDPDFSKAKRWAGNSRSQGKKRITIRLDAGMNGVNIHTLGRGRSQTRTLTSLRRFVRFKDGMAGYLQLRPEDLTGASPRCGMSNSSGRSLLITVWPGEIDLAPDAMYAQIARQRDGLQHVG